MKCYWKDTSQGGKSTGEKLMSAYRKGYKAEREIIRLFERKHHCECIRSAGSHTPVDVICGNGEQVYVIQVKAGRSRHRLDLGQFLDFAKNFRAIPVIAKKVLYHGWNIEFEVGSLDS